MTKPCVYNKTNYKEKICLLLRISTVHEYKQGY